MAFPVKMGRLAELEEEFGDVEEVISKWESDSKLNKRAQQTQLGRAAK